jgi:hypothetical protein
VIAWFYSVCFVAFLNWQLLILPTLALLLLHTASWTLWGIGQTDGETNESVGGLVVQLI